MLRTWDPITGAPMLAFGDRTAKFAGVATIGWATTGSTKTGTLVDARFTQYAGCIPFATAIGGGLNPRGGAPTLTISGTTLTWAYPLDYAAAFSRPDTTFIYGIF